MDFPGLFYFPFGEVFFTAQAIWFVAWIAVALLPHRLRAQKILTRFLDYSALLFLPIALILVEVKELLWLKHIFYNGYEASAHWANESMWRGTAITTYSMGAIMLCIAFGMRNRRRSEQAEDTKPDNVPS